MSPDSTRLRKSSTLVFLGMNGDGLGEPKPVRGVFGEAPPTPPPARPADSPRPWSDQQQQKSEQKKL